MSTDGGHRLRVGVLGAGPIAQAAHLEAVRKAHNCSLYAVCDRAPDLRDAVARSHRPERIYDDYAAMLADPDVDAVLVAIADQFHLDASVRALDAGKHVLVEKPMAVTAAEGVQLCDKVAETGLVLQVGTMRRFDEAIVFARDFLRDEGGPLIGLKAWYCDSSYRYTMTDGLQPLIVQSELAHRPAGNPKGDRRTYNMIGHGSHLVDTARFLGGEITAVQARLVEQAGIYSWFVACEFAEGASGHLDLTIAVRMDWHEGFQAYAENGSVIGRTFLPWYLRSSEVEAFSVRTGQYHRPLAPDGHFWRRQAEGFGATILDGVPQHGAGAADGLAALRVMEAIERSVDTGARVEIEHSPVPA